MFDELKNFLERFFEKEVFFLWNVGHSIWYLLAQNIFKPPKPFLITLRKEILSEIPNRWNQNNSNFTFYRLKSQTNCSKKLLHLNLHQNFDNVLLHGVNVCTQYLPSNRRLSIMFTIPISYYWLHSGFHNNCNKISTCPLAHEKLGCIGG